MVRVIFLLPLIFFLCAFTPKNDYVRIVPAQSDRPGKQQHTCAAHSQKCATADTVSQVPGKSDKEKLTQMLSGTIHPEIEEIFDYMEDPSQYKEMGAVFPRGILLSGPPGTGKTYTARALAEASGAKFISFAGTEFLQKYVGEGPQKIREAFKEARDAVNSHEYSFAILFIDEIDSIGKKRTEGDSSHTANLVTTLLTEMDGFGGSDDNVLVLAATNTPEALDPALLRTGRFDRKVVLELPNLEQRKAMIHSGLKGKKVDPDLNLDRVAEKTADFSASDVSQMISKAAFNAVRAKAKFIEMTHIKAAIRTINDGKIQTNHL